MINLAPLEIGFRMGTVLAGVVLALAVGFRLFRFPDLTPEGSLPLGAGLFAAGLNSGMKPLTALAVAMLAGALAGIATASIHFFLGINKFLAGILVVAAAYSLTLRGMGSSNIGLLGQQTLLSWCEDLSGGSGALSLAFLAAVALVLTASAGLFLRSRLGMRMRACGSNPEYAGSLGLNVGFHLALGLGLTNAVAALAGAFLSSEQGFADVGLGQGILVLGLAAMTLGEALVPKTRLPLPLFVACSALVGSVAYQIVLAVALNLGAAAADLKLVTAGLVLTVLAVRASARRDLAFEDA